VTGHNPSLDHGVSADSSAAVIGNLFGEYSRPLRLIAFNTDEGYARDVSHEITLAVVVRESSAGLAIVFNTPSISKKITFFSSFGPVKFNSRMHLQRPKRIYKLNAGHGL
jgi:hypothetical protein